MDLVKIPGIEDLGFSYRSVEGILTLIFMMVLITKFKLRSAFIIGIIVCTVGDILVRRFIIKQPLDISWSNSLKINNVDIYSSAAANWGKLSFNFDWKAVVIIPLMVFHHFFDSVSTILTLLQVP